MVLVPQRYTHRVSMLRAPKLPELLPSRASGSPGLQSSAKDDATSPVFSFEDDPSGMPMKVQNRALAGRTAGSEPKAKRTLLSAADVAQVASSSDQPEDAWSLAQRRVKDREEQWRQQQAAERLQKHARALLARKRVDMMRREREDQLRAAVREAAAALERAEQDRVAAEEAESRRLQQELAAAEAARVAKQRRDEALRLRVEGQRQRRQQRLELNRAATAAARNALPPDASAREVSDLAAQMLPAIERSVIDTCCRSRADTAPPGDHGSPGSLSEEDWAEFAGLFAAGVDTDPSRTQQTQTTHVIDAEVSLLTAEQATGLPIPAGKQRIHVAPPRPYDEWLQSCSADSSTHELGRPWRQQKGAHNRSKSTTAPPMLGKLGKLVLPPVSTQITFTRSGTGVSACKHAGQSWNFKSGAGPTVSLRVLSAKRRISAGMRELQSELMRLDRTAVVREQLKNLAFKPHNAATTATTAQ